MKLAADSIQQGEPVWFGCEVSKRFAAKPGIEDLQIHDYKLVFGVDVTLGLSKAERLIYGESSMSHAMAFTAATLDEDGVPTKFRVENSWGDERGEKGYLVMTADWFREFVFEVGSIFYFIQCETWARYFIITHFILASPVFICECINVTFVLLNSANISL